MRRFLQITLACSLLGMCGCSSSSTAASTTNTSSASSDAKVLRVGMECNYAPFNWTTTSVSDTTVAISSADYADGYDVVIASMLAEELGYELEIVKTEWDSLIVDLNQGTLDCVIAGMTATPERTSQVDFTSPYYVSQEVVIVRKGSGLEDITDIQDLSGYRVQGQMNTLYDTVIDQIEGVDHVEAATDFPASIQALQAGAVDAVPAEMPVAMGVCAANEDLVYVVFSSGHGFTISEEEGGVDGGISVSIAVKQGNSDLLNALESALANISEEERNEIMEAAVLRQPASD